MRIYDMRPERHGAFVEVPDGKFIELSAAEIRSGLNRIDYAEFLIKQLPETHDGRNTWLLNYGKDRNEKKLSFNDLKSALLKENIKDEYRQAAIVILRNIFSGGSDE